MERTEFTHLYQTHYPMLFRYVFRLIRDEEIAKDICQDVFMKLYTEVSEGKKIELIKSWLFKCATNDFLNRVKRGKVIVFEQLSSKHESQNIQNPEEKYIKTERLKYIEQAIEKVSPNEKQLIYLFQEDFSYAEISEIIGIKYSSVGKTLSRAIQKVSAQLHKIKCHELY